MRVSTAINHRDRFRSRISDIYYMARLCGSTHQSILDHSQNQVYSDPAWKKVPSWVQASVFDLSSMLSRQLYQPMLHGKDLERMLVAAREGRDVKPAAYLRWALRVDGIETTSDDICARREAGDETIWQRVEGAHIWNHYPDKPFSPWKLTNGGTDDLS